MCAGSLALHGENPYRAAPLYACESAPAPPYVYRARNGVALPAPLPGYALIPFAALSLLPFGVAAAVWLAVLLGATALAVRSCSAFGIPAAAALAVIALPLGITSLPFGELVPLALAALCACGAALQRRAYWAAVAWAALGMIEPHVGLPVLLALAGIEATRMRAAVAIVLLASLHALVTRDAAIQYFAQVLPQHAVAELLRSSQFSVSWMFAQIGVAPGTALGIGTISYALALGAGIAAAAVVSRATRSLAPYAIVAPAITLFGGTFMHIGQTVLALPAALYICSIANGRTRQIARVAVVLLAVPWIAVAHAPLFVPLAACAAALAVLVALDAEPIVALRSGLACAIFAAILVFTRRYWLAPPDLPMPHLDPTLADAAWAAWIYAHDRHTGIAVWLAKAPTWIALLLTAACAFSVASEERELLAVEHDAPAVLGA